MGSQWGQEHHEADLAHDEARGSPAAPPASAHAPGRARLPGTAAGDAPAGEAATELEPLVVTPRIAPLDEPYERLRKMLDADCDGCPPLIVADRESVYLKAGKIIGMFTGYGLAPPDLSPKDRTDVRVANDWRQAERVPEN